jgi:colicin import membrane protein
MPAFWREHTWPVLVSLGLHGLLVLGVILMTYVASQQRMPTLQPIPVDAVAVDSRVLHAAQHLEAERAAQELARTNAAAAQAAADAAAHAAEEAPASAANEAAVQTEASPQPEATTQAEAATEAQADTAAAEARATAAKAAAARQQAAHANAEKAAAAAQAVLDAQRAADARKALAAKLAADARQAAEARKAIEAQAADAKRAADERAKQDREAELRRQLADEEHVSAVESGPLRDRYITLLRNKIQNAWIKPASATAGVDCLVQVTQVPGGEVTGARVTQCNGDAAVRQSIENAVYRASPLPDPPDQALFERNLSLRFRPNE